MASLPDAVHQRLRSEFEFAAQRVAASQHLKEKLYYFSVFFGETGRQLNVFWDPDLALLFLVAQAISVQLPNQPQLPVVPPGSLPAEFLEVVDQVSGEIAAAFVLPEIDVPRLHAALARGATLLYAASGNGMYLYLKGHLRL